MDKEIEKMGRLIKFTRQPEIFFQKNGWGVAEDEVVRNMNTFYAHVLVSESEQARILHIKEDGSKSWMKKSDFMSQHANMTILVEDDKGKEKRVNVGKLWFLSRMRRFYNKVVFKIVKPQEEPLPDWIYNLWEGYDIQPVAGNVQPFLDFMREVICSGNDEHFTYLVALLAQMFQEPEDRPGVAVVLRGEEGVGKSFFVEKICELIKSYYFKSSNLHHIFGSFNSQLRNKLILHIEEARWSGNSRDEQMLKDLITGEKISVNEKHVPVMLMQNYLHVFITGNPKWLVSASFSARRVYALYVSSTHRKDTEYFGKLNEEYENGMNTALLHYFLNYDYSSVDLRRIPVTEELLHQKQQSMSGVEEWWLNNLTTGELPQGILDGENCRVLKELLYIDFCKSRWVRDRTKLNETAFGKAFVQLIPQVIDGKVQKHSNGSRVTIVRDGRAPVTKTGVRPYVYIIPSLRVCRELMDVLLEGKNTWDPEQVNWIFRTR
jgi:hypothetical protein